MSLNRCIAAAAIAATVAACGDRRDGPGRAPSSIPVREAGTVSDGRFSGRVARLADDAAPADTLRMVRLLGDSMAFAAISGILPVGRQLFVSDRLMSQHLALVDLESGTVLERAGRDGEGPGEFRDPGAFMVESVSPPRAWVYDFDTRRLALVSASPGGGLSVVRSQPFNAGVSLEQPIRIGDQFVANGLFPDYTLLVLDSAARPVQQIVAEQPFPAHRIPHVVGRRLLNRSYLTARPDRKRLALAYQWTSRIDFFSEAGDRMGTIKGPRPTTARYKVTGDRFFWQPQSQMAYTGVQSTARYVYAAFCGCREADDRDQRSQRIHVFRWNGDFVTEIQLDRRMTAFAVAQDDSFLYGAVTEPHPGVAEWSLSALLPRGAG